jgi:SagB-type dehydrogenase family enzyme
MRITTNSDSIQNGKPKTTIQTISIIFLALIIGGIMPGCSSSNIPTPNQQNAGQIALPTPELEGKISLEEAVFMRRSIRQFGERPLSLAEAGQLLWAAQGVTDEAGYRTAPSAGALYPLEVYLVAGEVENLPAGIYRYLPDHHALLNISHAEVRSLLATAALKQTWIEEAPAVLVFTAIYERTTRKYGERGIRYVHMEVGHAAQNIYLQATALDLGTVFVGAFYDDQVSEVLGLPKNEVPLGLMPVGSRKP